MKFLKRHGQLLLIFTALTEIIMFMYLNFAEDRPAIIPEQPIKKIVLNIPKIPEPKKEEKKEERIEKPIKDVKIKNEIAINIPKSKTETKKEEQAEKTEIVKKVEKEVEIKAEENIKSLPLVNYKGTHKGGGDKKGFPLFHCDELLDKRDFLSGLYSLGVKEFIVLNGKEVKGVVPFNSQGIGEFQKKETSMTGEFQRLISRKEIKVLGIKVDVDFNVGFYLPAMPVVDALKSYMANHELNYKPEDLNGFRCRYYSKGFEVVDVYK